MAKLLIILLVFPLTLSGQNDYLVYHSLINKAEEHFGDEQFDKALAYYDSAFTMFEYAFVKDYLIAAQIATIVRNNQLATRYLEQALIGGFPYGCIAEMPIFQIYLSSNKGKALSAGKDSYRQAYYAHIRTDLLKEFSERYRNEQDTKSDENRQPFLDHRLSNFNRIRSLMDSLVFPSERVIGLDDSTIAPNRYNKVSGLSSCNAANSKVIPTLLHYHTPIKDIGFEKFIKAIKLGYLHPKQFAHIYSAEKARLKDLTNEEIEKNHFPVMEFEITGHWYYNKIIANIEKINADRKKLGICTVETDMKRDRVSHKYRMSTHFGYK